MRKLDYTKYGSRREYVRRYMKEYNPCYRREHATELKAKRLQRKLDAIALKGGRCQRCGYNKCSAALSFHHRNPREKDRQLSVMFSWSWARIVKELRKCDLLCMNCHAELHFKKGGTRNA